MADLIYPTTIERRGPWLISAEELHKLDEVVEELIPSLERTNATRRADWVEDRIHRIAGTWTEEEKNKLRERSLAEAEKEGRFQISRKIEATLVTERKSTAEPSEKSPSIQKSATRESFLLRWKFPQVLQRLLSTSVGMGKES